MNRNCCNINLNWSMTDYDSNPIHEFVECKYIMTIFFSVNNLIRIFSIHVASLQLHSANLIFSAFLSC